MQISTAIKFWFFSLFCLFWLTNSSFAYKELMIEERWGHAIRVIKVWLDGEHFVVASPAGLGGATTEELAQKVGWDTAINGAFFCPDDYSNCKINGKRTTHTISERVFLWDGKTRSTFRGDTSIRAIFSFDKEGNPFFVQKNSGEHDIWLWSDINKDKLDEIYFGIGNFPVLLLEWEDVVPTYNQYIDNKMKGASKRNFICSTQDWRTVYMGVVGGISIPKLPAYLKKYLNCRNALSLDAGASTAMVYDGNTLDRSPRTRVMDAFVVLTRDQYIKLTGLTPTPKQEEKTEGYQWFIPSSEDQNQLKFFLGLIDAIYKKYGKTKYQTALIKLFRWEMSKPDLPIAKKWLYNQILISLFTIDSFKSQ